jgi:hypothetical protein
MVLMPASRSSFTNRSCSDVDLRQSASELGYAVTAGGILPRYPKDRMLVGIERNGLAMLLQIALQSLEIGKRAD